MSIWLDFLQVFAASLIAAAFLTGMYALGLRLLTRAGRVPVVGPVEFTDAITVISPAEAKAAAKRAAKAARKSPLTQGQKNLARAAAYACFGICGAAVLFGIYLIVPALHGA